MLIVALMSSVLSIHHAPCLHTIAIAVFTHHDLVYDAKAKIAVNITSPSTPSLEPDGWHAQFIYPFLDKRLDDGSDSTRYGWLHSRIP